MLVQRIVIIGGGFGGLALAKRLSGTSYQVVVIDKRNFHLFQPLLYQVATGGLSPAEIASPIRGVLSKGKNIRVVLGEVVEIDRQARTVATAEETFSYDFLVVAAGTEASYFGRDEWMPHAPALKTIEDALTIRSHIFQTFEAAELSSDDTTRRRLMTFVVVGGGATGVELAGALAEIATETLQEDFRSINSASARILLIETADEILAGHTGRLRSIARAELNRLGVEVRLSTRVEGVDANGVDLNRQGTRERIEAATVLWAAGVRASSLGERIVADPSLLDRMGRVRVSADLSVPGNPEIFVIGDLALLEDRGGPLPGIAPVAIEQGEYLGHLFRSRLRNKPIGPFRYSHPGMLATIGRNAAVGTVFGIELSGHLAWVTWVFVHIMKIVEFENRVLVFIQWVFNYLTRNRGARLITGETQLSVSPVSVKQGSGSTRNVESR